LELPWTLIHPRGGQLCLCLVVISGSLTLAYISLPVTLKSTQPWFPALSSTRDQSHLHSMFLAINLTRETLDQRLLLVEITVCGRLLVNSSRPRICPHSTRLLRRSTSSLITSAIPFVPSPLDKVKLSTQDIFPVLVNISLSVSHLCPTVQCNTSVHCQIQLPLALWTTE
jgi:hypothetical protein